MPILLCLLLNGWRNEASWKEFPREELKKLQGTVTWKEKVNFHGECWRNPQGLVSWWLSFYYSHRYRHSVKPCGAEYLPGLLLPDHKQRVLDWAQKEIQAYVFAYKVCRGAGYFESDILTNMDFDPRRHWWLLILLLCFSEKYQVLPVMSMICMDVFW